jgi:hypothetical protein
MQKIICEMQNSGSEVLNFSSVVELITAENAEIAEESRTNKEKSTTEARRHGDTEESKRKASGSSSRKD